MSSDGKDGTEYAGEFRDGYAWGQGEKCEAQQPMLRNKAFFKDSLPNLPRKWATGRTYSGEWVSLSVPPAF